MLGAILGDMAGSRFEWHPLPKEADPWQFPLLTKECRPTDDTAMTLAVARAIRSCNGSLENSGKILTEALIDSMHDFGSRYPDAGYGASFKRWLTSRSRLPYNSFGNGSAMRVSPAGWAWDTLEETQRGAALTACVTHNHVHGVAGACAVASAIFLARTGRTKQEIRAFLEQTYHYDLSRTLAEIQPSCSFDVSCQVSVPEALTAFLESSSCEEAIRLAIWLGADADTQGAIAGGIAEAMFGMPEDLQHKALDMLDKSQQKEVALWQDWLAGRGRQ